MKLLYIVPKINNEGGVARVLSIKLNYFAERFGYEIHMLTQNQGNFPLFYSFNEKIVFHDMVLEGSAFNFFNSFRKAITAKVTAIQPDIIMVCDNGLKAFTIPFILSDKIPIVFECHGSKFIEEKKVSSDFISIVNRFLKYKFKNFGASKFSKLVALSNESLNEWNVENGLVIPNPCWAQSAVSADLKTNKVIAVARNSYEKGLDRLLLIWKKVTKKYPDWTLEIYGDSIAGLQPIVFDLGLTSNVILNNPIKNISEKYLSSSLFVMTSRSEGFPMALLEALAFGLPSVAFDCPVGPRAIIKDGTNGFLVEDGNLDAFAQKLELLFENEDLRMRMGKEAKKSVQQYKTKRIMQLWKELFENLVTVRK